MKHKLWRDLRSDMNGSPLVLGVVAAFITSLLATLVMSAVYTWTDVPETTLPYTAYTINAISVLVGSILAARSAGARGWYYGGASALLFSAALAVVGSLVDLSAAFQGETIVRIILLALIGAFGGMVGVNLRR